MGKAKVATEKRGPAAWITLTAPQFDADLLRAIADACENASGDTDVRAIVLAGDFTATWAEEVAASDPFGCFTESTKPVIAAIDGEASCAGLALALAADIRIAGTSARLGPLASTGALPLGGAIARLARLVGRANAIELLLVDEQIDANQALRIGLISEVAEDVTARAQEIVERIGERGPLAVQYAKEAVSRGIDMPLEQALRFETDLTVILQTTEDRAEGVRAFQDKRKPKFKGR